MQLSALKRDSFLVHHAGLWTLIIIQIRSLRLGSRVLHTFGLHWSHPVLVAPNPARVIFRTRDYRIAGIVESS